MVYMNKRSGGICIQSPVIYDNENKLRHISSSPYIRKTNVLRLSAARSEVQHIIYLQNDSQFPKHQKSDLIRNLPRGTEHDHIVFIMEQSKK